MNSLQDLNGLIRTLTYTDLRNASVTYDRTTPTDGVVILTEGQEHDVPVGINIVNISNPEACQVYYTIDYSDNPDSVITWPVIPDGASIVFTAPYQIRIGPIFFVEDWLAVRSPVYKLSNDYFGSFSYTATITAQTALASTRVKSWTVNVIVSDVDLFSDPSDFDYNNGQTETVTGTPQVVDTGYDIVTYTVTLTPSNPSVVGNITSSDSQGGQGTINNTTKVYTITGTKNQVNWRLSNLSFTSTMVEVDFTMQYQVTATTGETSSKTQLFHTLALEYLGVVRGTNTYVEDTPSAVNQGPLITDNAYTGSDNYTLVITPTADSVKLMSSTGTGGTSIWSVSTKKLTIVGTKSQVNSHINNITVTPSSDYNLNFTLEYKLTTPQNNSATKYQLILLTSPFDNEVSNITDSRQYYANETTFIFSQTIFTSAIEQSPTGWKLGVASTGTQRDWIAPDSDLDESIKKFGTSSLNPGTFQQGRFYSNYNFTLNNNFTVEFWYYQPTSIRPTGVLCEFASITGDKIIMGYNSSGNSYTSVNGTVTSGMQWNEANVVAGWNHLALVCSEGRFRTYINGTSSYFKDGSITSWAFTSDAAQNVGDGNTNGSTGNYLQAGTQNSSADIRIDEFRVSGIARYTANFTPATSAFTLDTDTRLLCHFDSTPDATYYTVDYGGDYVVDLIQSTPQITDFDPTGTYTVTMTTNLGNLSYNNTTPNSTLILEGTKSQINALFALVKFTPSANSFTTGVLTYQQIKNGITQVNTTIPLVGNVGFFIPETLTFTSGGTWTPTLAQSVRGKFDILVVGGGGGGSGLVPYWRTLTSTTWYSRGSSGGSGGAVNDFLNVTLQSQTYNVTVGTPGTRSLSQTITQFLADGYVDYTLDGTNGGSSSFAGYSAAGGQGGKNSRSNDVFNKTGGSISGFTGGTGIGSTTQFWLSPVSDRYYLGSGGGGAGAGGSATNGTLSAPGNGGPGKTSAITGLTYAAGGYGSATINTTTGNIINGTSPSSETYGRGGSSNTNAGPGLVVVKIHY
jgi:hypothetical protein